MLPWQKSGVVRALPIAGIYSHVASHEKTVQHLETGYLVSNNPETWEEAFERLLFDDTLRLRLADNAQEYVFSNRTLAHSATRWADAISSILDERHPFSSSKCMMLENCARRRAGYPSVSKRLLLRTSFAIPLCASFCEKSKSVGCLVGCGVR